MSIERRNHAVEHLIDAPVGVDERDVFAACAQIVDDGLIFGARFDKTILEQFAVILTRADALLGRFRAGVEEERQIRAAGAFVQVHHVVNRQTAARLVDERRHIVAVAEDDALIVLCQKRCDDALIVISAVEGEGKRQRPRRDCDALRQHIAAVFARR